MDVTVGSTSREFGPTNVRSRSQPENCLMLTSPIQLVSSGLPEFNPQRVRSRGVHLSDVINDIVYGSSSDRNSLPNQDLLTLGRVFEWALIDHYKRSRPGEFLEIDEVRFDGIIGHPDLYHVHNVVHEIKYTARSSRGPSTDTDTYAIESHPIYGDKFWSNWIQNAGYCIMLGRGYSACRDGMLELCHYRGDYGNVPVVHNRWARRFYVSELEAVWSMIKTHSYDHFCQSCGEKLNKCPANLKGERCPK